MARRQTAFLPFWGSGTRDVPALAAHAFWPKQMVETSSLFQFLGCPGGVAVLLYYGLLMGQANA
eukprot:2032829-Lingulodinium_polyedra.AAC.1